MGFGIIGGGGSGGVDIGTVIASLPAHYQRDIKWAGAKTTITPPTRMAVNINNNGYLMNDSESINIGLTASWDSAITDYTVAANRAGKDFYIYACKPVSGAVPVLMLSASYTVPTGYTVTNSRKVAGFHCLCVAVGTVAGHPLSDYVAGDILPASVWDLTHRPVSDPEGMVYVDGIDLWVDIYLSSNVGSGTSKKLLSAFGGVIVNGETPPQYCGFDFAETYGKQNKRLLFQSEYECATQGHPQAAAIADGKPSTAGGHVSTGNVRLVSNFGLEDGCGVMHTWMQGFFYASVNVWGIVGGCWGSGSDSGSRFMSYLPPDAKSFATSARGCAHSV